MNFVPTARGVLLVSALTSALALCACGKSAEPAHTGAPTAPAAASVPAAVPRAAMQPAVPASVNSPTGITPTPAASSAGASTPAAPPLKFAALNLGTRVGKDFKVTHAGKRFNADDHTLYAAVDTTGQATGANLGALWTYQDGQKVNQITQSISADGPATTTFKVHNRNDWPAGIYKVVISLDGKTVGSQQFEIVAR